MQIPLFVSASGILAVIALGFMLGLHALHRHQGERYIRQWALAWAALAVHATAAAMALLATMFDGLGATRRGWALLSIVAAAVHLIYLAKGLREVVTPGGQVPRSRLVLIGALLGAASILLIVPAEGPEQRLQLYHTRMMLLAFAWGGAYLCAAQVVYERYVVRDGIGRSVLLASLISYGGIRLLEPLAYSVGPSPILAQIVTFGGLPLLVGVGVGMLLLLLEVERDRRIAALAAQSAAERSARGTQATLARREQWFQSMIEKVNDVIVQVTPDGTIEYMSPAAAHILGLEPAAMVSTNAFAMIHPEDVTVVRDAAERAFALDDSVPRTVPFRARNGAGEYINVEAVSRPFIDADGAAHLIVAIRDVRERQRLETELVSARRLEAIGRLAGGVAHDFNNLLTAIGGNLVLMRERTEADAALSAQIAEVANYAKRGADLTRRLLAFARRQMVEPRPLDVLSELRDLERLLTRVLGESCVLQLSLPESVWTVRADPTALEQVMVNLAINARDAMPMGGELRIRVQNLSVPESGLEGVVAPHGDWVRIDVQDTGVGIHESVLAHVFEPFFTTKESSGGSGLGLATVYGAVKQAGGHVSVTSDVGVGSTFTILLPRVQEVAQRTEPAPVVNVPLARAGETILLIEDEPGVREVTTKLLERLGYAVITADDGVAGIARARAHSGRIDLIISDLMMPRMNGLESVSHIRAERPNTPVVFISGYSEEALRWREGESKPGRLLAKPFSFEDLASASRGAIDSAS